MSNLEELRKVFAKAIHSKVLAIITLELTEKERSRMNESISDDIRKYSDLIPPWISKKAKEKARKIGIDLSGNGWHDQTKFDKSRKIFHFEHFYTVKSIREKCLNAMSEEEIVGVLDRNVKIIWILKDEDKKLTELGHKSNREDPEGAYKEAGIEIA